MSEDKVLELIALNIVMANINTYKLLLQLISIPEDQRQNFLETLISQYEEKLKELEK